MGEVGGRAERWWLWGGEKQGERGGQWCLIPSPLTKILPVLLNGLEGANGGEETSNSHLLKDDASTEPSLGNLIKKKSA